MTVNIMAKTVKTGGRVKGTANKVTAGAKANIMQVFEMLGGAKGFYEWAVDNQTEFYRHYARLIPAEINAKIEGELTINKIERVIVDSPTNQNA